MNFLAEAHLKLVDAETSEAVYQYDAEVECEFIHNPSSPGPFFSAIVVIPGVINGATRTFPRGRYRESVEPLAFQELWRRIESQMVADQAGFFARRIEARAARCGDRLDRDPEIGQQWDEFIAYQSAYCDPSSEITTDQGHGRLYDRWGTNRGIRVMNGEIVGWEEGGEARTPAVSAPPPAGR